MISALVAAAGSGLRLGSGVPKALVPIAGRAMLLWSVEALARVPGVTEVIVASPPGAVDRFTSLREEARIEAWRTVVPGGDTRGATVARLLDVATGERVLVHDAARPCVATPWVAALLHALGEDAAGIPALPVRDTLKRGRGGVVTETIPREGLYVAQTPQIFDTIVLRAAYARSGGAGATDDAALVEATGVPVRLLPGDASNIKVTFPDDVALATAILEAR